MLLDRPQLVGSEESSAMRNARKVTPSAQHLHRGARPWVPLSLGLPLGSEQLQHDLVDVGGLVAGCVDVVVRRRSFLHHGRGCLARVHVLGFLAAKQAVLTDQAGIPAQD